MPIQSLLSRILCILFPLAIASSFYLYLYPIFHACTFALPSNNEAPSSSSQHFNSFLNTFRQHASLPAVSPAPFRLLILADPQLEGDSSLPSPNKQLLPCLRQHWSTIRSSVESAQSPFDHDVVSNVSTALRTIATKDLPRAIRATQKRLDLLGNDFYLAHIYRTLHWWTRPTHVTVLGDLIGSQWVTDGEFDWRGARYWNRVFKGGERVADDITVTGGEGYAPDGDGEVERLEAMGDSAWERRIINIAGNHDIGYAGDVSEARIERFERMFGRANWDVRFQLPLDLAGDNSSLPPAPPTLHLINLNSLTLDTPALVPDIQSSSYAYVNDLISKRSYPVEDRSTFTLLLTHLPLHKEAGICTDGPDFTFFESDDEDETPRYKEGGLREQNHLSEHVSANGILQGIFGMTGNEGAAGGGWGRNGLILTGHDHTGCDVVHFVNRSIDLNTEDEGNPGQPWKWSATRYTPGSAPDEEQPSIREVTLRSMMGEFGGNAGLLSVWFDADPAVHEWKYEISMCALGVQHIWWAVHVLDIIVLGALLVYLVLPSSPRGPKPVEARKASGNTGEKEQAKR